VTPTLAEILAGNARAIASLATEGGGQDFAAAKLSVVALLSLLAAQEADAGAAARLAENAAIRAALADAGAKLPPVAASPALPALDAENAGLRRALVAVHAAAEEAGDTGRHHAILRLYRRMAELRRLPMPDL
jgi:hypothetical protein